MSETVKRGDLTMEFNINIIEATEYPTVTLIIVRNKNKFEEVLIAQLLEAVNEIITISL